MSQTNPDQLRELFERLMSLDSKDQQRAGLRDSCPDDAETRNAVWELIQASERARCKDFLNINSVSEHGSLRSIRTPILPDTLSASTFSDTDVLLSVPQVELTTPYRIGRYRIDALLGEGGFGRVYRAFDEDLDRAVAIKVPRVHRVANPQNVEAYLQEARTLARLKHPRIVPVYDVGRTDDGQCFVVSELLEGGDLAHHIVESAIPILEAAELIRELAEALHVAHEQGLVHRDIKPANILLDETGNPHLADFGLALCAEDCDAPNGFVGTPAYMSPEQASGQRSGIDARSDIYSLGVVLYELLTGRRPFQGSACEIINQLKQASVPVPRTIDETIPRQLETICLKALAPQPTNRFQSAKEFALALDQFLASFLRPTTERHRWARLPFQASLRAGLLLVFAACVILTLGRLAIPGRHSNEPQLTQTALPTRSFQGTGHPAANTPARENKTEREVARAIFQAGGKIGLEPSFEITCSEEADLPPQFNISAITLAGCTVPLKLLEDINQIEHLVILILSSSNINDRGLRKLTHVPQLRDLYLSQTRLQGHGLATLAHLKSLRNLTLDGIKINENTLLEHLRHVPQITHLSLQDNPYLSSKFYHRLIQQLPELCRLAINGNLIDRVAAEALATSSLWGLSVSRGSIGEGVLQELSKSQHLEYLWLCQTMFPSEELPHLIRCQSLRTLDLSRTVVGDDVCEVLCQLKQLTKLDLRETDLSRDSLRRIREATNPCQVLFD